MKLSTLAWCAWWLLCFAAGWMLSDYVFAPKAHAAPPSVQHLACIHQEMRLPTCGRV